MNGVGVNDFSVPRVQTEATPDLLAVIRRQWVTIVIGTVVGLLLAQGFAAAQAPSFEARSTLLLTATTNDVSPSGGRARTVDVDTWATVARSTDLLRLVADDLGDDLGVVQRQTSANAASTGDILFLTHTAPTQAEAVEGAAVYSNRFLETRQAVINSADRDRRGELEDLQQSLTAELSDVVAQLENEDNAESDELADLETQRQILLDRIGTVSGELDQIGIEPSTGRVVVQPATDVGPVGLPTPLILLSGLIVGSLAGFIAALVRDRFDDRYGSLREGGRLGVEQIATLPYEPDATTPDASFIRLAVRLAIGPRAVEDGGRTILVLAVESETLPDDASAVVAAQGKAATRGSGFSSTVVRRSRSNSRSSPKRGSTSKQSGGMGTAVDKAQHSTDLVFIPRPALDQSPVGIALAATADVALLLVSDDTDVALVDQAIEDVRSIGSGDLKIAVLPSFAERRSRWWNRNRRSTDDVDDHDDEDE